MRLCAEAWLETLSAPSMFNYPDANSNLIYTSTSHYHLFFMKLIRFVSLITFTSCLCCHYCMCVCMCVHEINWFLICFFSISKRFCVEIAFFDSISLNKYFLCILSRQMIKISVDILSNICKSSIKCLWMRPKLFVFLIFDTNCWFVCTFPVIRIYSAFTVPTTFWLCTLKWN